MKFDRGKRKIYRERVQKMFYHAYDSYLLNAFPFDELRPLTCDGVDTWGSYSLTLIDALDTLIVMGNKSEFRRVVKHLETSLNFDKDVNVSVFETNIRVVGGLLAAHLMLHRADSPLPTGWPCNGPLLTLAEEIAQKILPAFKTNTGMPFGTVNLRKGVPSGETPITCTAGVATYILEFGVLSRLTGDPVYEETALQALRSLWLTRTRIGLVGNHIDVQTGEWKALDAGIGAGVDSYYEYLAKGASAFQNTELLSMLIESVTAIFKHVNHDDWYFWVSSSAGHITMAIFQSLEAFWPGVLASGGHADPAYRSIMHYMNIWRHYGFTPEFFEVMKSTIVKGREGYPLRPELIESLYHLYRVTKDPMLLHFGAQIFESIESISKVPCGYATVKNVETHSLENRMESFFLAETTKYLYLLFDDDNFVHYDSGTADIIETAHGECVLSSGNFIFNTEAHPFDLAGLDCCSADKQAANAFITSFQSRIDFPFLFGLTKDAESLRPKRVYQADEPVLSRNSTINTPKDPPIGKRSLEEWCNCDIPLADYARVCVRNLTEWLFLTGKCPAVFCADPVATVVHPVFSPAQYDEIPLGSPDMLTCTVTDDNDFVGYGEINLRA
ncbi:ER degradation-enhancing alpha-mannosidase-like protein 2 [Hypsibius exemplaris]|uniref:alpha-1,2-Mannosidase n=1 Tax=Hypsibius exemplaris TaxID=2072580 RepID=A0A1W0WVY0_HYPEX|nr:ER degradation-enhancing alpha-mannosidase-like protein 2 [Hypsibius exemplaris]